jgi:hypothetical protein
MKNKVQVCAGLKPANLRKTTINKNGGFKMTMTAQTSQQFFSDMFRQAREKSGGLPGPDTPGAVSGQEFISGLFQKHKTGDILGRLKRHCTYSAGKWMLHGNAMPNNIQQAHEILDAYEEKKDRFGL